MKAVSAKTMASLDAATIAAGTAGSLLMERAGQGVFREIIAFASELPRHHRQEYLVFCGKGNNGGDGYVIARLLAEAGHRTTLISVVEKSELSGDARANAERLPEKVEFTTDLDAAATSLKPGAIVIDCLLGTGISGAVREPFLQLINLINASGLPVIAVDVPSGLNGDTGDVVNAAIVADMTVTMELAKTGLLVGRGAERAGRLRRIGIGILPELIQNAESPYDATFTDDIRALIRRLPNAAHKTVMGKIAIIGGSDRYPGSIMLSAHACARSGGGLVTLAFPMTIRTLMASLPNAIIQYPVMDHDAGQFGKVSLEALLDLVRSNDVIAIGPGIGRCHETIHVVHQLMQQAKSMVLDADALSVFEEFPAALPRCGDTIITPHPGEMRQILKAIGAEELLQQDRVSQARELAKRFRCCVILKGARTVIAAPDGQTAINTSGTPALATGGSGDVLCGMAAAWMHQFRSPFDAARVAVFLHGLAAEITPAGMRNMIPDDLPLQVGQALYNVSPFA